MSTRIGVISDTHGLLRPEVLDAFANVDHILHAGDIGGEHVLDALRQLAPVTAVRGNVDADMAAVAEMLLPDVAPTRLFGVAPTRLSVPPTRLSDVPLAPGHDIVRMTIAGLKILMTHILPRPSALSDEVRASLERDSADVVVFGHSHLPHHQRIGGVLYLNPASAGPRRFDYPVSVAVLEKQRDGWIAAHVPLDRRSITSLRDHLDRDR